MQRDALMAVIDGLGTQDPAQDPTKASGTRDPVTTAAAPESEKNADRLPSADGDTRKVETTPWSANGPAASSGTSVDNAETGSVEGTSSPRTVGQNAAPFQPENNGSADPAEEQARDQAEGSGGQQAEGVNQRDTGQTEAEQQVAAVNPARGSGSDTAADRPQGVQQAVLYEEASRQGEPSPAVEGQVEWEMVRQSVGGGDPEPVVRAVATIPDRDLAATLTIRENRDSGLPASHLIELEFDVPPSFEGGGVKNVPGIIMKESEQSRGEPLRGAAARVSSGLFWIALSEDPNDRTFNMDLLATRDWIDIPVLYDSGRRAILTLRKGSDGFQSVDAALREWSQG